MIELKHNIAYAKFAHVDDLDLDYGRTVKLWQADTLRERAVIRVGPDSGLPDMPEISTGPLH